MNVQGKLETARSGKLSDNTIFQNDDDDLMGKIQNLMKEKEKLQVEISRTKIEMDGWIEILGCSTAFQLEELHTTSPTLATSTASLTTPQKDLLLEYSALVDDLNGIEILDFARAYPTEEGSLLICFPWRPPNKPHNNYLVLITPGEEYTYRVQHHNLPTTVPVMQLENDYLKKPQGPEGVRRFVTAVGQYVRPLYARLQQIMALEGAEVLEGSAVNHNKGATTLDFILVVSEEDEERSTHQVEFVLEYHPLDILPHMVSVELLSGEQMSQGMQKSMEELKSSMKVISFPEVVLGLLGGSSSSSPSMSQTETEESSASQLFSANE